MFYAEDKARLRHAMREQGLKEVRFRFEFEGTRIIFINDSAESMPVLILAGGFATRLRPLTEHIPKALIDVLSAEAVSRES